MAGARCIILACMLACAGATAVTPVQKVLTMMTEMKSKGEKMMAEEAKTFASYTEWVSDTSRELGFEIKTGKSDAEKYLAAAAKADSDVAKLGNAIGKLQGELGSTEAEKAEATSIRNEQHASFSKTSTDYSESVMHWSVQSRPCSRKTTMWPMPRGSCKSRQWQSQGCVVFWLHSCRKPPSSK